jgi:hypothetical protein
MCTVGVVYGNNASINIAYPYFLKYYSTDKNESMAFEASFGASNGMA